MLVAALGMLIGLASPVDAADSVEVVVDRDRVSVARGERFAVESVVTNRGADPVTHLKAHLNVASLTGNVSVDPEDWSDQPIVDIPVLPPGASTSLTWDLKAGDIGGFALYVVLLPAELREPRAAVAASVPTYVETFGVSTRDAAGTLPFVVGIPVVIGALAGAAGWRRRRVR